MRDESPLQHIQIVLVEPSESLNVGAVARAMSNFGFCRLSLVSAENYCAEKARRTGCHAEQILAGTEFFDSLQAATASCHEVIGFTARESKNRLSHEFLPDWLEGLAKSSKHEISLVFGPERTGLRNEHLESCHRSISIPTTGHNTSLNLAQAVLLVLYEVSQVWADAHLPEASDFCTGEDYARLQSYVLEVAAQSGFLGVSSPETMPGLLKQLFQKQMFTQREMRILLGLFSSLKRCLRSKCSHETSR